MTIASAEASHESATAQRGRQGADRYAWRVLKRMAVAVLAIGVIIGFALTLSFGDSAVERPRTATQTPMATAEPAAAVPRAATPFAAKGALAIAVSEGGLVLRPRRVRLERGLVTVALDNGAPQMVEVVFARGTPARLAASPAALERARVDVIELGTGERQQTTLEIVAGTYTVAVRPLTQGTAPPAPALADARLRVLR